MKRLLVLCLFATSAIAHADAVSTLERGVQHAGKLGTDYSLDVRLKQTVVTLRKDPGTNGVIGLRRNGVFRSSHGYFLNEHGELSVEDREALNQELASDSGNSRKTAIYGLRQALRERRAFEAHVAKVAPQIDAMLAAAKQNPEQARVINSRVSYEDTAAGPTLIVDGTGVFIGQQGFTLLPQQRADLARYLK